MDHTFVDEKSLKSLEDYAFFLLRTILSLTNLQNTEIMSLKIGIMKEDQAERSNTIVWDLKRIKNLYQAQLESVLELLPEDFKLDVVFERIKEEQLAIALAMIKQSEVKR